jgi:hypothetical protein
VHGLAKQITRLPLLSCALDSQQEKIGAHNTNKGITRRSKEIALKEEKKKRKSQTTFS